MFQNNRTFAILRAVILGAGAVAYLGQMYKYDQTDRVFLLILPLALMAVAFVLLHASSCYVRGLIKGNDAHDKTRPTRLLVLILMVVASNNVPKLLHFVLLFLKTMHQQMTKTGTDLVLVTVFVLCFALCGLGLKLHFKEPYDKAFVRA